MAWKLRKDKQDDETVGDAGLADTAVPDEPVDAGPAPIALGGPEAEAPSSVLAPPAPEEPIVLQELSFAPPVFAEEPTLPPVFDEEPTVTHPVFDEEPAFSTGPFVSFDTDEPMFPASIDREELASSLVMPDADTDVPRVAPFIVDVPSPFTETPDIPETEPTLRVRIGSFSASFPVTKEIIVIGRPDSVLQSYPDVEIELDDAVSRRHAEIRHQGGNYVLVDMNSTNGTLLNGQALEPEHPYLLTRGDRIHIGDRTEIFFE